ncbi:MAG: sulfite reductase (NADPH) hemoprotein beta-component [Parasphingorhabdus sp.]|jgi:sulfite reductase (NADPH) hemoprotein beta-component
MYQYNEADRDLIDGRVEEFRGQTDRFLSGELTDDQFKSLRLLNGLYVERNAPMLRVSIPYGQLSSTQLRRLAYIARRYDRGYGHVTTRQNMQFNWLEIPAIPDLLADLAEVEMHAVQASGNCIRNITADHLAGLAVDEIDDPRTYCELIRQWANFHPEFAFLPRKFKIAVTASQDDRAASEVHDIGLHLKKNADGDVGFEVLVGGGLGRSPFIASSLRSFLPRHQLLGYLEAVLRVYNLSGRRDNKHKARIKILLNSLGIDEFQRQVEAEWQASDHASLALTEDQIEAVQSHFLPPKENLLSVSAEFDLMAEIRRPEFALWKRQNTLLSKLDNYRVVYIALKGEAFAPGDITAKQMDGVADIADQFSLGMIRTTHTQNLLLPHVSAHTLFEVWQELDKLDLAIPVIGTVNDTICCPGLEFCSLANASSIPVAGEIRHRFKDLQKSLDIGDIQIKISGCMNACGHHHVGHIGILGVDKKGSEWYQLTLGGSAGKKARLGDRLGPAVARDAIADAVETIVHVYVENRLPQEEFLETYLRIGLKPFREAIYA